MERIAWIDVVPDGPHEGRLGEIYGGFGTPTGAGLDHVLKIHSLMPQTMEDHYRAYATIMRAPGPLTRTEREIVGVVVSGINGCHY